MVEKHISCANIPYIIQNNHQMLLESFVFFIWVKKFFFSTIVNQACFPVIDHFFGYFYSIFWVKCKEYYTSQASNIYEEPVQSSKICCSVHFSQSWGGYIYGTLVADFISVKSSCRGARLGIKIDLNLRTTQTYLCREQPIHYNTLTKMVVGVVVVDFLSDTCIGSHVYVNNLVWWNKTSSRSIYECVIHWMFHSEFLVNM